jgi:hypothetical protein
MDLLGALASAQVSACGRLPTQRFDEGIAANHPHKCVLLQGLTHGCVLDRRQQFKRDAVGKSGASLIGR